MLVSKYQSNSGTSFLILRFSDINGSASASKIVNTVTQSLERFTSTSFHMCERRDLVIVELSPGGGVTVCQDERVILCATENCREIDLSCVLLGT